MGNNSYVDFEMKNKAFFQELEKIGVMFNEDGNKCKLISGEEYMFFFEDGDGIPYLGFEHDFMIGMYIEYFLGCGNSKFGYHFMKILTENGFLKVILISQLIRLTKTNTMIPIFTSNFA